MNAARGFALLQFSLLTKDFPKEDSPIPKGVFQQPAIAVDGLLALPIIR